MAAHLFVFYFGAIANLTPPIALAAFAGAGIVGSDPQRTGWISCKLALAGFIVPFIFIYKPGLLILESSVADIAFAALATLLAVLALAAATEGFLFAKMNWIFRLALIAAGILLIFPEAILMGSGLGIMIAISVLQFMKKRNGIKTIEV